MNNRTVGTRERYTYSDAEIEEMCKRSGLNPRIELIAAKQPGKILVLSWGRSVVSGCTVEWTGKEWKEC